MLKFYRRIRKKLIEGGNVHKYLLYAIGEILLVVIGILIALQINNWNEQKKIRSYELTMLQEVNESLESDLEFLNNHIPYLENAYQSYYALALMKNDPLLPTDSLAFHLKRVKEYGMLFNINMSPYEAIKSGGLDKISNVKIRNQLSKIYGFQIPGTESWINEVLRVELFIKRDSFRNIFSTISMPSNGRVISELVISDPNTIYDNPEFDELLLSGWPMPHAISQLHLIRDQMIELQSNIHQELTR